MTLRAAAMGTSFELGEKWPWSTRQATARGRILQAKPGAVLNYATDRPKGESFDRSGKVCR